LSGYIGDEIIPELSLIKFIGRDDEKHAGGTLGTVYVAVNP
jgi:hypothetical protein